ncbi:hypothetical protein [Bryobacter aggregatus]|uniref:hypothetical protein n=1 Tax=Bryobacter aggregatus TaxID=360054 RepID=UPI0004E22994|nr:hypothetical protein [Bryobacter aggregatus]
MYCCIHSSNEDEEAFAAICELALQFSPQTEPRPPQAVLLGLRGLERLLGDGEQIARQIQARLTVPANLSVAATANAAYLAAKHFRGLTILKPGQEASSLASLSISKLPMPPEMLETLRSWGIRNFAGFTALPPLGILERFGEEGLRLQGLACGLAEQPLRLLRAASVYQLESRLDYTLDQLEPLLFLLNASLLTLCERMLHDGVAAGEIQIDLGIDTRSITLPYPLREAKVMLKILHLHLESNPPAGAITKVDLKLVPVDLRVMQGGLFQAATPEPARLQLTLARLAALVGEENLGAPRLLDSYRPDAYLLGPLEIQANPPSDPVASPHLAIRLFRPPLPAEVRLEQGQPRSIRADGVAGKVSRTAGPWRSSGDWWNELQWRRDEWDVALEQGGIYRIYRQPEEQWFVDGVYD